MDISTLCDKINLQPEIKYRVLEFANSFDFSSVDKQLKDFRNYEKMDKALKELQEILNDDDYNIKTLTCMLKASADIYELYKEKNISDKIYFETMKCYTRFIDEAYNMFGIFYFNRYFWTMRQAGFHLFRIGELEYDIENTDGVIKIGIHVPSDADFSPEAVDISIKDAKEFFKQYFPETENADYYCQSWLMDSQLENMLDSSSNILNFQKRFDIVDKGEITEDHIGWVFLSVTNDYSSLPENTSLQKKMKKHILSGGIIRDACGKLK